MKLRRFLPFFIILLIVGGVGFVVLQHESGSTDSSSTGVNVTRCAPCIAFQEDMNELRKEPGYSPVEWRSMQDKIQNAGLDMADKNLLLVNWAQLAFDDWGDTFNGWAKRGQDKPNEHQQKIKGLKSMLAGVNQLTADRLKTLTRHSQAFKNFNWLTRTDFASNFESKQKTLLRQEFSEAQYTALEDKVSRISQDFPNRPEVPVAQTFLQNQRVCHRKMHDHYNDLVSTRRVKTEEGHSDYSPTIVPIRHFQFGQRIYRASEFTYYYNQGQSSEWETPVWN